MSHDDQESGLPPPGFEVPLRMRALVLDGTGFEHLKVRTVPTPKPGPDQILARVDAAGVCTSLIKLVEQGSAHPLIYSWRIEEHPLILGDEGAVTLVRVGKNLSERYRCGERFVIQPAVDHPPMNHRERYREGGRGIEKVAVGYTLPGHLAEYILIMEEVLEAGCLVPLPDQSLPYAHAAMSEPFSCAISSQDHHVHLVQENPLSPRQAAKGLKAGGVTVIIGAGAMGRMHLDLAFSYRPRAIVVADLLPSRLQLVEKYFGGRAETSGTTLRTVNPGTDRLEDVVDHMTEFRGADDVIVAVGSRSVIENALRLTGRQGNLNLFGGLKKGEDIVDLDTGIVHYREIIVTGSSGGSPWDVQRTLELMAASEINPENHISCIGDLEHARRFLKMIKAQELNGKAVTYPHRSVDRILSVDKWTAQDEQNYLSQTSQ